jgi:predicted metal-binding protein
VINTKNGTSVREDVNINRVGCTAIANHVFLEVMSKNKLVFADLTVDEAKELINEIQLQLIKIGESVGQ